LIGVTDEGELARSIASYLDEEVVVMTSPDKVLRERPRAVIHTLEVDADERAMWNLNVWFALNVARAANKVGSINVFLSSYMIFDGRRGYYSETAVPSPLNYYGMTKLVAETAIAALGNYLILRVGQVITRGFMRPILNALIKGKRVKCNANLYLSPISLRELGQAVSFLLRKEARGVINLGGKRTSQYNLCLKLSEALGGEVVSFEGKYLDFSLDDWLLRSYGVTVKGNEL
jgi:dTDP-4-dehydrorhamnose reductase